MDRIKVLQDELAQIDANQHNLADPIAATNTKLREIIAALVDEVIALKAAVGLDRAPDDSEQSNVAKPALQAVADLAARVAAIEEHPALSVPALDQPSTASANAPESTNSIANSGSEAPAGAVDSADAVFDGGAAGLERSNP